MQPPRPAVLLTAAGVLLASCSHVNPYYDASRPHHRAGGFQNNHVEFRPRSFADLLKWRYTAWRDDLPPPPRTPVPTMPPDMALIRANAGGARQPAVTWVGHATVLLQMGGINLLTDPIFSERASPLSFVGPTRAQPPAIALAALPRIDVVIVSHNHYDHLDAPSIDALAAQPGGSPLFIVPLGIKPWLAARGVSNAVELDWWQQHRVGAVDIVLTPTQHWSGRSLTDRMRTLWGGYALLAPDLRVFFAGDTGYSPDFAEIGRRHGGFDLALLPIGAYEPRWFMREQHVNPAEAVQMHRDLRATASIGIHWGTFQLTDESLDAAPLALADAARAARLPDNAFSVLAIGQTQTYPPQR